jgi:hypothetical protein
VTENTMMALAAVWIRELYPQPNTNATLPEREFMMDSNFFLE